MKTKTFDCVEMKRGIQERIYEETQGMDARALVTYFRERVEQGPFADLWRRACTEEDTKEFVEGTGR
jgi:hypothetical protein